MEKPAAKHLPISDCLACGAPLAVTRLSCAACGTEISGVFAPCPFCSLPSEEREVLEIFLLSRGNLKEVERRLGVSYPTARARVDAVIERLGLDRAERGRLELLEAVARGDVDVDTALSALGGDE